MDDEKKGFVFLKSYYLAIKELPDAQRLEVYDAMCKYALDGVMPEDLSGIAKAILCLIQPTIDASQKRWERTVEIRREAGRKSGEARRNRAEQNGTNDEQKQVLFEQNGTNNERTANEQGTKANIDKDKEKDKEMDKDKDKEEEKETLPPKSPQGDGEKEPSLQERRFEEFWSVYPKKRSRDSAWRAWKKISPNEELCAMIVESVSDHIARDPDWKKDNGQFIPYPATYLNGGGWQDEYSTKPPEPEYDPNDPYKYWK